jgi:amphi-Trp domain-containing protein
MGDGGDEVTSVLRGLYILGEPLTTMEEVLFETESVQDRSDIADYFEQVAENLRHGTVTLVSGDDEITLEPPQSPVFEVKVEREQEGGEEEMSVEFEVEWDVGGNGNSDLSVK